MLKFENVNILENLEKIMNINTKFYKSDFKLDKEILLNTAQKSEELSPQDKTYLWMTRECGTWCLEEKSTFLKGSSAYNTWIYYGENKNDYDKILAYTVEIKALKNKTIIGNLYQIDYPKHCKHVKEVCIQSDTVMLVYKHTVCIKEKEDIKSFNFGDHPVFGKFLKCEDLPNNPSDLKNLLNTEKNIRKKFRSSNIQQHINELIYKAENSPT